MLKRDLISYLGKFVQVSYLDVCYETVQGFLVYDRKTRLFTVVACPQDPHFSGFTVGFEAADFFASQVFDCWESMVCSKIKDPCDVAEDVFLDTGTCFQNYKTRSRRKGGSR